MSEKPPKDPYEGLDIEGVLKKTGEKKPDVGAEKQDERTIEEIIQALPEMTREKIDEITRLTEEKVRGRLKKEGALQEEIAEAIRKVREQGESAKNQLGSSTSK